LPFIKAGSIPEAYAKALQALKGKKGNSIDHLIVEVSKPLRETLPLTEKSNIISKYEELLTFGSFREFHEKYKSLVLRNKSGKEWIEDRIRVLCPNIKQLMNEIKQLGVRCREELSQLRKQYGLGYQTEDYVKRLTQYGDYGGMLHERWERTINQLAVIIYKLAKDVPYHKQKSFVYGVLSTFDPLKENLQLVCDKRTVNIGQFPCLSTIDLKLTDNVLNLCALWRHQYFDIKAYGNWISLALLLKMICDLTNYFRKVFGFKDKK
jgi:thymidylate synthase